MTDFFADLEAELLGAARRRAAGGRIRRDQRRPGIVYAGVVTAAVLAFVAFVVAGAGRTADPPERRGAAPVPDSNHPPCPRDRGPLKAPAGLPPDNVLDSFAALPRDSEPRRAAALPRVVVEALQDLRVRAAYVDAVGTPPASGGVSFFVVATREAKACAQAKSIGKVGVAGYGACLFAVEDGKLLASSCEEVGLRGRRSGASSQRQPGRTLVLGFASGKGITTAWRTARGGQGYVRPRGNVIAQVILDSARIAGWPGGLPVRSEKVPGPAPPPADRVGVVSVLNGTTTPGLASRTAERLSNAGISDEGLVGTWRSQAVRRSVVLHSSQAATAAGDVARLLGIDRLRVATAQERSLGGQAPVVVILGRDQVPGRAPGPSA